MNKPIAFNYREAVDKIAALEAENEKLKTNLQIKKRIEEGPKKDKIDKIDLTKAMEEPALWIQTAFNDPDRLIEVSMTYIDLFRITEEAGTDRIAELEEKNKELEAENEQLKMFIAKKKITHKKRTEKFETRIHNQAAQLATDRVAIAERNTIIRELEAEIKKMKGGENE